jgi:hypothetical protein
MLSQQVALTPGSRENSLSGLAKLVTRELSKTSASVLPAPPPTAHVQHAVGTPVGTAAISSFGADIDRGSLAGREGSHLGRIFSGKVLKTSFQGHVIADAVRAGLVSKGKWEYCRSKTHNQREFVHYRVYRTARKY